MFMRSAVTAAAAADDASIRLSSAKTTEMLGEAPESLG